MNKHVKKYRGVLSKEEQKKFLSRARQQAKQILSKKYKSEYDNLVGINYRRIRRLYFKELKGGLK